MIYECNICGSKDKTTVIWDFKTGAKSDQKDEVYWQWVEFHGGCQWEFGQLLDLHLGNGSKTVVRVRNLQSEALYFDA